MLFCVKPNAAVRRYEILLLSGDLTRRLGGGRLTNCKSGKDRTGMSVTLEQVHACHAMCVSSVLWLEMLSLTPRAHSNAHVYDLGSLACIPTAPHEPIPATARTPCSESTHPRTRTLGQARILALSHMLVPRENIPTSRKPAWKVTVRRDGCLGSLGAFCVFGEVTRNDLSAPMSTYVGASIFASQVHSMIVTGPLRTRCPSTKRVR